MSEVKNELKVSVVQCELHWQNVAANLKKLEDLVNGLESDVDVVILPEMFTTGFSMNPENHSVKMGGDEVQQVKDWAKETGKAIVGSLMIEDNGDYFNRLLWVNPNGEVLQYDKKHLFTYAGEHEKYSAGTKELIVSYKGWKVACFTCYDLRFPVWSRNIQGKYDVALYVANWPEKRNLAWKSLLVARSIENQCYVLACNRVGEDGNGIKYSGDSAIIDFEGNKLQEGSPKKEEVISTLLLKDKLERYRQSFPVLNDADSFKFNLQEDNLR